MPKRKSQKAADSQLSGSDREPVEPNKNAQGLNKRQALFVKEYLVDLNGTRAAKAAGYSENGADVAACRLLANVRVAQAIEEATEKRCEKLDITADRVLGELAKLGFANMLDYLTIQQGEAYVDFSQLTREQAAAIQEVTCETYMEAGEGEEKIAVKRTKFKLADKRGALELLGRRLKLFTDKVELSGGFTLINKVTSPKRAGV